MKTIIKYDDRVLEEVRKLISEGRHVSIAARGNSMNPFIIDKRDQVTLGPWKNDDITKRSVVLVKDSKERYILHRVIRREGDILTLMGDGNLKGTETTHISEVIGIMKSVTRKGREYSADSFIWKAYSGLWMGLSPIRRWILGLWRRLSL